MIPLHVHSNNTFLNGTIPVEKLLQRCVEHRLASIALTDTNTMHGIVQFAKIALDKNIKPIIGCLIDSPENSKEYIILLARNNNGYSELCKIITSRKLNDDFALNNLLKKQLENLFIITPSIDLVKRLQPKDNLLIELIASKKEKRNNRNRYQFALEKGFKFVVTNPIYFFDEKDFLLHKTLTAVRLKTTIDNLQTEDLADDEYYFKNPLTIEHGGEIFLKHWIIPK
jgi:DNA polymerase III alpha subunit